MKINHQEEFYQKSIITLKNINEKLQSLPILNINYLNRSKSALIIVDMVNGFAREGALSSPRITAIIPEIVKIQQICKHANIPSIAFADAHDKDSPEFDIYPAHCKVGTYESEIVQEVKNEGPYLLIEKSSTNAFHENKFKEWLSQNHTIENFIIIGDCTDICIEQFALSLKTWFNYQNRRINVYVPLNAVETYDYELHNGDLMNIISIYNLLNNGIKIVKSISDSHE
ncbi:MAG: cysteine hydrolase [Oligoflexia bacterium]|nr:cysteine hydrolase [Oligoflexia bacterium]MBF0364729.1 cysteine hydrolase [Oligoflexia bacterium]